VNVGDKVELGIRPEDASVGEGIQMNVRVLERLGGTTIAYGSLTDGTNFCATLDGVTVANEGEALNLSVNPADCHMFDAQGRVLRRLNAPTLNA
ncbi:MAG: TOBE domain-containing protein, partial [Paracoccaceae bacterium]|nr:TOBE domain-containing protein [Paracoccaceae bacterium]